MNELQIFAYEGVNVRTVTIDGEPYFVGKDVAEVLGYKDTVNALKLHCRGVVKCHPLQTAGGMQEVRVLAESDVYRLVISSKLPGAEKFEKWVMEEVLPSIRKHGGYLSPTVDFTDPEKLMVILQNWAEDRKKLVVAETRIDRLVHNNRTYTTTEIAKELGFKSAQELNDDLSAKGILYKNTRGVWLLYAEYSGKGFQNIKQREINGAPRYYAEWTGIGREWLMGLYAN